MIGAWGKKHQLSRSKKSTKKKQGTPTHYQSLQMSINILLATFRTWDRNVAI